MKEYLALLEKVLTTGKPRPDRTGTGTLSTFGEQLKVDLNGGNNFPLLTTKKIFWRGVVVELIWFLRGDTNVRFLQDRNVHIWDEWADKDGELGPVYGKQWRSWFAYENLGDHLIWNRTHIDQLKELEQGLWDDPFGRRHIVTAWNPADIGKMRLPPCHTLFQCYVSDIFDGVSKGGDTLLTHSLSLHLYARSIDIFLGLPFNIASYALLLSILAKRANMIPSQLIISFGDLHLYRNHIEQAKTQLARTPKRAPVLELSPEVEEKKLEDLEEKFIGLLGYEYHAAIPAPVAI